MNNLGNKDILAKNLQNYMDKRGIGRNGLSDAIGVPYTTVTDWLKAKTYPRIDKIELMARFFGISKSDLIEEPVNATSSLYEAAAGQGRVNDGSPSEEVNLQLKSDQVLVKVSGRSMEPTLLDGDIVVVEATSVVNSEDDIMLVKVNGEEDTLKHVKTANNGLWLIGENSSVFPPKFYTADEVSNLPVTVKGIVITLIREMK